MSFSDFGAGLCAAALVCAVSGAFTAGTASGRAAKACAGLYLACYLLTPLGALLRQARQLTGGFAQSAMSAEENADCGFLCALVEQRAAALLDENGYGAARVRAQLDEDGIALTVTGAPDAQREGIAALLEAELGIAPEFSQ